MTKRLFFAIILFLFSVTQCFAGETSGKCKGDRVNVRARANATSEVVTQLGAGEEVVVLGREGDWVEIKAPAHSKCWIFNGCIGDGKTIKENTNMRCGPGQAFPVLAQLKTETPVKVVEVFGEWTRVEPPVGFSLWVNFQYLEIVDPTESTEVATPQIKEEVVVPEEKIEEKPAEPEIISSEPAVESESITEEQPQIVPQQPDGISVPEENISGIDLVSFSGKLEDIGVIVNKPGTYKLLDEKGKWVCILRSPTIDANPYAGRVVRIEGVALSKTSSWGVPVVELKKLNVIK